MEEADKILEILKQGDKHGLELLFNRFYRPLVMYAMKFVPQQEDAEDIVQEIFIKFWESKRFNLVENYLRSYLYNSVRNRCLTFLEGKREVFVKSADSFLEFPDTEMPDEEGWHKRIDEIYKEIDKLPERTREVFTAVVIGGRRYKEVADDLNISVNTLKTTLSRALTTLRVNLSEGSFSILMLFL